MFPSTARTLLVGPFVNANHTAELLELAAFTCLFQEVLRSDAVGHERMQHADLNGAKTAAAGKHKGGLR